MAEPSGSMKFKVRFIIILFLVQIGSTSCDYGKNCLQNTVLGELYTTIADLALVESQCSIQMRYAPVDGSLVLPFKEDESIECGNWREGSLDYPYFGAMREGSRKHGAIDIYTDGATAEDGGGMIVRAVRDGVVLQVIQHFYQRSSTGEITQAVLIDHGQFTACYCEIRGEPNELGAPLFLLEGDSVEAGEILGYVSGTKQLHFEMYEAGTTQRSNWYGDEPPPGLLDPTDYVNQLYL